MNLVTKKTYLATVLASLFSLNAMAEQFESASVMTTMSVETMLNMPQENLANILGRLPGLAASEDQSRNGGYVETGRFFTVNMTYNF